MINLLFEPLPDTVEVSGNFYKIATDFRDWIAFFDMLADEEITSRQKISLALQWITDEIPPDIFQAYNSLISFASCDGIHFKSESKKSVNSPESPSLSWLYDSAYVLGAFRQVYNIDLIRVEYMHWWEFCGMLWNMPDETSSFLKVIAIRNKKVTSKMSKEEKEVIAKAKVIYALDSKPI